MHPVLPGPPDPREVLVRVRSVLRTCLQDTAATLEEPARRRVLLRRLAECDAALKESADAE